MSLADHWDGQYLTEGEYDVRVLTYKTFEFNSGNPGVEFSLESGGLKTRVAFVLVESSFWLLASFAKACGLSREEAAKYNPAQEQSHRMLVNRSVRVRVIKNEKGYHEVDKDDQAWWLVGEVEPPSKITHPESVQPPMELSLRDSSNENCPF